MKLLRATIRGLPSKQVTLLESEDDLHNHKATHLVMGENRRTTKALLAACSGAQIVSTEWVDQSSKAGAWLDAAPFCSKVRFGFWFWYYRCVSITRTGWE